MGARPGTIPGHARCSFLPPQLLWGAPTRHQGCDECGLKSPEPPLFSAPPPFGSRGWTSPSRRCTRRFRWLELEVNHELEENEGPRTRCARCGGARGIAPELHAAARMALDERYHHGHFYPRVGAVVARLPVGYRAFWFRGNPWYFVDGIWYVPGAGGFVVARPLVGLTVTVLPPFATPVWIAGSPYYYANDVYYRWDPAMSAYEVVAPPAGADQAGAAPKCGE